MNVKQKEGKGILFMNDSFPTASNSQKLIQGLICSDFYLFGHFSSSLKKCSMSRGKSWSLCGKCNLNNPIVVALTC